MTAHLTLPYKWVDCAEPETCEEYIHLEDTQESLNSYPREWIEIFIGNCEIEEDRIAFYNEHNQLHRTDGPAVIHADGRADWCYNGKVHREDGPAVKLSDGTLQWRQNGHLHRTDGPAIERADGRKQWYTNGRLHSPPLTEV